MNKTIGFQVICALLGLVSISATAQAACSIDHLDRLLQSQSTVEFKVVQPVGKMVTVPFSSIELVQVSAQRFDEPVLRVTGIWSDLSRTELASKEFDLEDLKTKPLEFSVNDVRSPWEYSWAILADTQTNQWTLVYYWVCDPYYFENQCVNTVLIPQETFELNCE